MKLHSKRYLGLELGGAKNPRTTLSVLEHYPKENKTFLLDTHEDLGKPEKEANPDEHLIKLINQQAGKTAVLATSAALTTPPCLPCKKNCKSYLKCSNPSVKWMRDEARRATKRFKSTQSKSFPKPLTFTPYTQRPIELWMRYRVFPEIPVGSQFVIDETMGGSRAPLTARMNYLHPRIKKVKILEAWPKLTIALLAHQLNLNRNLIQKYRNLQEGAWARKQIIESLADQFGLFIYHKDSVALSKNLASFDGFLLAFTALLADQKKCISPPKNFPHRSGWVWYPKPA